MSAATPFLAYPARRTRADDADHEVDEQPDDGDLDSQDREPDEHSEQRPEDAERQLQNEQAEQGEGPDGEDGAEHGSVPVRRCADPTLQRITRFQRWRDRHRRMVRAAAWRPGHWSRVTRPGRLRPPPRAATT